MSKINIQGAAYRKFSRKRYTEIRSQAGNLRQAEIVAKIIREWEAMDMEQRNKCSVMISKPMLSLSIEPQESPLKGQMLMVKAKTNQKTTGEKKVQKSEVMGNSRSQQMEEINVREFEEQSPKSMKTKKISQKKDRGNSQYILFFKSYFNRLLEEHPKWSARQITSIIKLLWKKRKVSQTKPLKPLIAQKAMSGRTSFRKMKGLSNQQAKDMWKRLPTEAKKLWRKKENLVEVEKKMNTQLMTLKTSQGRLAQNNNFMDQRRVLNMK